MKTRIMLISALTTLCIFVFSGATWADSKKNRRHDNKPKQQTVSKHRDLGHHQDLRRRAGHAYKPKHHYHPVPHRARYHHYYHRPYQKPWHHRPHHYRRVYSHTKGNTSILASTSGYGWKIQIFSLD